MYDVPPMADDYHFIGHSTVKQELVQDIERDNVSHAYLFAGPRHVGKLTAAHWFSRLLVTQGLSEEEAVQVQNNADKLLHPDILVLDQLWIEDVCDDWDIIAQSSNVAQEHRAKAPKAKTDTISIDDIRSLQERLYETGTGTWRCCLIRSIERMQDAAANAFLKILEEPPEGLVFLLTTQSLSTLLPTIISRTRTVQMHRLPQKELLPLLDGVAEEDQHFLLRIAQGAPGTLISLKEDPDALRDAKLIHSKALSFWKEDSLRERMSILKPLHKRGKESDQFLFHLALALRERESSEGRVRALNQLCSALETNTHRQLLSQQFAMRIGEC